MSGTSVDGIDVAIVDVAGSDHAIHHRLLGFHHVPYRPRVRNAILSAGEQGSAADLCHLNVLIGEIFAQAALTATERIGLTLSRIKVIGSHGQTVCHLPKPVRINGFPSIRSSLQLGEPAVIAERTGITTVANFRARDLAAGGEGAPLTPYVHYLTFQSQKHSRLVVNLGGIANITYLPARGTRHDIQAFDVGPCNMLLDGLISCLTDNHHMMDRHGRLAQQGIVHESFLKFLQQHQFFRKKPPKTTGREEFGNPYVTTLLKRVRQRKIGLEDLLATCCQFIAQNIAISSRWLNGHIDEVIVGGGGIRNRALMTHLASAFHPTIVQTMDAIGTNSKAFEALAFAIFAYQTIHRVPANLPQVTGAREPVVLGTIVPGRRSSLKYSFTQF